MKRTEFKRNGAVGERIFLSTLLKTSDKLSNTFPHINAMLTVLIVIAMPMVAYADQYTAYSLKVAQQRIERAGENWRQKEPEVANLAGIKKVEGFVFDSASGELILVGQKEQGRAALTLDDLVVALRARFCYNEWPLVSIDPTPDTEKTQMQHVRFEGGIEDTAFGQAMFEADYRLKEIGIGLQSPGIVGLKTYWDRNIEQLKIGSQAGERNINSRFWFYPISPHVTVRKGVCVVRGLKVGVFTEVMVAKINEKQVEDITGFEDAAGDAFASDVSQKFNDLCKTQPSFNRLRGLQELVAVSKALEDLDESPDLSYWLEKYQLVREQTEKGVEVLRRKYYGKHGSYKLSGGVRMTVLAIRLKAGDVKALREAVLTIRPSSEALSWSFVAAEWLIPIGSGQVKPEDIAPLFSQAMFLREQKRHADSVTICDEILKLNPDLAEAWYSKGALLNDLGQTQEALDCCKRALEINPRLVEAWYNKSAALYNLGQTQEALDCCKRALEINPRLVEAWYGKGMMLNDLGQTQEALACYEHALEINPRLAKAWYNKGQVLGSIGRTLEMLECYNRALEIDPTLFECWHHKGVILGDLGQIYESLKCFDNALEINPQNTDAWCNKGVALYKLGRTKESLACFERALEMNSYKAWYIKGLLLSELGRVQEALHCFDRALEINPHHDETCYNKGNALLKLGKSEEALKCYSRAIEINPCYGEAWGNKGAVLGLLGRNEDSLECCNKALEINPSSGEAWCNKGIALYELHRYSEARQAFQKAADMGIKQAQQKLDTLAKEGH